MYRSITITLGLLIFASVAASQRFPGDIRVSDSTEKWAWYDCNIDPPTALLEIYIGHMWNDGATQSKFSLRFHDFGSSTLLGETWYFPAVVGNSKDGVTVYYGECLSAWNAPPILLGKVSYLYYGPPCAELEIAPHPDASSGKVEALSCSGETMYPRGNRSVVDSYGCPNWCIWPVQETTWGAIKSLYWE